MAKETLLRARTLTREFGSGETSAVALQHVDLKVAKGEFLAITGRSGSGKTTLLNLLGGLDRPTSGTVNFEGQDLTTMSDTNLTMLRRRKISFIFQSFGLLPLLSAWENVELPLRINGVSRGERHRRVDEVLALVGLGPRSRHRPYELSGGEQQRVAIARSLVVEPGLVLADEPTGDLDSTTGLHIINMLKEASSERNITIVVATHDLVLARMADRVENLVDGRFTRPEAALR
jgi:putative ABC transport system ATP-binding protein